jgi:hypothetical protein
MKNEFIKKETWDSLGKILGDDRLYLLSEIFAFRLASKAKMTEEEIVNNSVDLYRIYFFEEDWKRGSKEFETEKIIFSLLIKLLPFEEMERYPKKESWEEYEDRFPEYLSNLKNTGFLFTE